MRSASDMDSRIKIVADRMEMWPTVKLIPYKRNPRTHSPEQINKIVASIRNFGFTNPILIDSDAGIIAGHGRLVAAQLATLAGWDEDLLKTELAALQDMSFDLDIIGFVENDLAKLLSADNDKVVSGRQGRQ
jgi:ParB-like chromosome segregation protein Spo0J